MAFREQNLNDRVFFDAHPLKLRKSYFLGEAESRRPLARWKKGIFQSSFKLGRRRDVLDHLGLKFPLKKRRN